MNKPPPSSETPRIFEPDEAQAIAEQAQLILARMIPECTARRYQPSVRTDGWQTLLCFAGSGPIVPILPIGPSQYGELARARFWYGLTLWKDGIRRGPTFPYVLGAFSGPNLKGSFRLDSGPQAIAEAVYEALGAYDLNAIIAAATPERVLKTFPSQPQVWQRFMYALCAIYLRRFEDAGLLLDAYLDGNDDTERGWIWADMFNDATAYSRALKSDPESVRESLIEVMNSNWSHLNIVDTGAAG
jgi:hypothetical protein